MNNAVQGDEEKKIDEYWLNHHKHLKEAFEHCFPTHINQDVLQNPKKSLDREFLKYRPIKTKEMADELCQHYETILSRLREKPDIHGLTEKQALEHVGHFYKSVNASSNGIQHRHPNQP